MNSLLRGGAIASLFVSLFVSLWVAGCASQPMAQSVPFTPPGDGQVTWYRDVLPIARAHCQGCHVDGGIGPFSMASYADAKDRADLIFQKVQDRTMPPWMPDDQCSSFVDDRRLSDADQATLLAWVSGGTVEGDPADAPPGGDAQPQHLATADVTLMPDADYTPKGDPGDPNNLDDYHCTIIDPKLASDRDVIAYEVEPGVVREVHHVILYTVDAASAQQADAATPEPGWTCFGGPGTGNNFSKLGSLGGWVPGMPPIRYPDTTGIRLKAGDVIVMQVHYNLLNGPAMPDRTTIKLDYADAPVQKVARWLPTYNVGFAIPPHTDAYASTAMQTVPVDAQAWGITPHMHTLGRHISVKTDSRCLVDVPAWDFHWQQSYFYTQPVPLKSGETASITCTWSNPTDNTVTFGEATTDEMCLAFLYVTL